MLIIEDQKKPGIAARHEIRVWKKEGKIIAEIIVDVVHYDDGHICLEDMVIVSGTRAIHKLWASDTTPMSASRARKDILNRKSATLLRKAVEELFNFLRQEFPGMKLWCEPTDKRRARTYYKWLRRHGYKVKMPDLIKQICPGHRNYFMEIYL